MLSDLFGIPLESQGKKKCNCATENETASVNLITALRLVYLSFIYEVPRTSVHE